jgi:hypothetical protein
MPRVSSPPTTASAESIATVTASHFGQRWRWRKSENGTRRAPSSTATRIGMTISRSWMMRKTTTAITPPMSRSRHDQAAARRMPNGTDSDASRRGAVGGCVGGCVSRSRDGRRPMNLPRTIPFDPVIAPV